MQLKNNSFLRFIKDIKKLYNDKLKQAKQLAFDNFIYHSDNKLKSCRKLINFEKSANKKLTTFNENLTCDVINHFFV